MNNFWDNINKFPRFLISVLTGFFLTTLYPIFELLTNKKNKILFTIIISTLSISLYYILRLMLDLK